MKRTLLPLLSLLAAQPSFAGSRTWDGGDATSNLSASLNWNPNAVPLAGDSLIFPDGVAPADRTVNNNFPANTEFASLQFNGGGYTFGGAILKLVGGGVMAAAPGVTTFNGGITFVDTPMIAAMNGADLRFGAGSQIYTNAQGITISALDTSSVTFDGILSVGGTSWWLGDGTMKLRGAKALHGDIVIHADVEADSAAALGPDATDDILLRRILRLQSAVPQTLAKTLEIGSDNGTDGELHTGGANHTLSGAVRFYGDQLKTLDVESHSLTLSGSLYGPGSTGHVYKSGPGTLRLTGAAPNTFTNLFIIDEGLVELAKTGGPSLGGGSFQVGDNIGGVNTARATVMQLGQLNNPPSLGVYGDGWLHLMAGPELAGNFLLGAPGKVTMVNGSSLTLSGLMQVFGDANDDAAWLSGDVRLTSGSHDWILEDLRAGTDLLCSADLPAAGEGARILLKGDGDVEFSTDTTIERITISDSVTVTGDLAGWDTDLYMTSGKLHAAVNVQNLNATSGTLDPGPDLAHVTSSCDHLMLGATTWRCSLEAGAELKNDRIVAWESVTLANPILSVITPPNQNYTPGDEFILISTLGTEPVSGTFLNLPEGSQYLTHFRVSYAGGNGNDVSLTWIIPPTGVTKVWDGGGADNKWTTAANWNNNTAPQPGDALLFPAVAARKTNVNDFVAGTSFQSITIGSGDYNISGQFVYLNSDLSFQHAGGTPVWNVPVEFTLPASITSNSSPVQVNAPVRLGNNEITLRKNGGTGEIVFNGGFTGVSGAHLDTDGDIRLTAPGLFPGSVYVNGGTLTVTHPDALPGQTIVMEQAALRLDGGGLPLALDNAIFVSGVLRTVNSPGITLSGMLSCHLESSRVELDAPLTCTFAVTGDGALHKTGPAPLILTAVGPFPPDFGLFVDKGEVHLAMAAPDACNITPIVVGNAGAPASLVLTASHQLADHVAVEVHPDGTLNAGTFTDTLGSLTMTGGLVTGTSAAPLVLSTGLLHTHAAAVPAVINARIATAPGIPGQLTVADGPASPDLSIQSRVYGELFEKHGPGRADFTASQPVDAFDKLDLRDGSALFFSNSQFTAIALNGGTLGGHGTVGEIISGTGGTIAPGASPGALGGYKAVWNTATTLRMELNGLSPGADYDQYFANALTDLGTASLELTAGFDPAPGDTFMIIRNVSGAPVTGTFAGIPQNGYVSAPGAIVFQINYTGGDGDDVVLTRIPTTPPEIVTYTMTPGPNPGDDTTAHFVFQGLPGLTYWLQTSTDLKNWQSQKSAVADLLNGQMTFDLLEPAATPRTFYRLILP